MKSNIFRYPELLVLLAAMAIIGSCGHASEEHQPPSDTLQNTTAVNAAVNAAYPFGSPLITTLTLPKKWEADPENYGSLQPPDGLVFDSIAGYYEQLNTAGVIAKPEFVSVKVMLPITSTEMNLHVDSLIMYHLDSCRFRLPDTRLYECYYFSKTDTSAPASAYGNILLIRKDTRSAQLVQAYHMQGGEQSVKYQFFTINREEISLYSGWYYDDGITLNLKQKIKITE